MKKKPRISFVIPCFNEEGNVTETFHQLTKITKPIKKYEYEFIFIDNCSSDKTRKHIRSAVEKDKRVTGIVLSRNFGPEASGLAGLEHATGDAVIICVCDLQDPLELIPQYLKKWEEGNDIVLGTYTKTQDAPAMALIRSYYYRFFKAIANIDIPVNSSGICLLSRNALDGFLQLQERFRSNVGLLAWIGFKRVYIPYERRSRRIGKSSYNLIRYLKTAERGFFGFSYVPLDSIIYFGLITFAISFVFLFFYILSSTLGLIVWNMGTGIITVTILFGAIQLLAISAIGKYVQVIVEETKKRPHYIIDTIMRNTSSGVR